MRKPLYIITGNGRCGSSLIMQMFEAGGMPGGGKYPAFEEDGFGGDVPDPIFWKKMEEAAGNRPAKILDPHRHKWPKNDDSLPYRPIFIWMARNPTQQARSHFKFIRACGQWIPQPSREDTRSFAASLVRDQKLCRKQFTKYSRNHFYTFRFESLISQPDFEARILCQIVPELTDWKAMAAVVKDRGPECLDKMLEVELIHEREGHAG